MPARSQISRHCARPRVSTASSSTDAIPDVVTWLKHCVGWGGAILRHDVATPTKPVETPAAKPLSRRSRLAIRSKILKADKPLVLRWRDVQNIRGLPEGHPRPTWTWARLGSYLSSKAAAWSAVSPLIIISSCSARSRTGPLPFCVPVMPPAEPGWLRYKEGQVQGGGARVAESGDRRGQ